MKNYCEWFLIIACCLLLVPTAVLAQNSKFNATSEVVSNHFLGSSYCVRCHDNLSGENATISLVEEWRVSMMAFSFVDPLWQAKVRSETLRLPDHKAAIEKKCVRCHAPMATIEAEFDSADISLFDGGFADRQNPYYALAFEGVSCTLCHQIRADHLGTEQSFSGGFVIGADTSRNRPLYAQVPNPFQRSMQRAVKYLPTYGSHIQESEVCATCHELMTPYVDMTTNDWAEGTFAEQTPYSEWLESMYSAPATAKGCHDCHLTHEAFVPAARSPRWLERLTDFSRHTYFTENLIMLDILESFARELRIDGSGLAEAAAEGADYLATAGSLEMVEGTLSNGELVVSLEVHNHTGHKLPTSIPIRRVYLHLLVTDSHGGKVFESGGLNPDGSFQGGNADVDLSTYEPHYEVISQEDQVQIYEGIMGDTLGEVTYTLLTAAQYLKDNRLLPDGFDKEGASDRVRVYGAAYDDANFSGGRDMISYRIAGLEGDEYRVLVELRDQTMAFPFLKDLFLENGDATVANFERMYRDPVIDKETGVLDTLEFTILRQ